MIIISLVSYHNNFEFMDHVYNYLSIFVFVPDRLWHCVIK